LLAPVAAPVRDAGPPGGGGQRPDRRCLSAGGKLAGDRQTVDAAERLSDWKGHEARISLGEKLNGRKQYSGDLIGADGEDVLIDVPGLGETRLPFAAIHSAKLVMTDRLIAATAPLSVEGADEIEEVEEGPDGASPPPQDEAEED
jgi:hypothetical protein